MKYFILLSFIFISVLPFAQDTSRGYSYYKHSKKKSIWIDNKGEKHNGYLSYNEYAMGLTFFYPNDGGQNIGLTPQNTKYFLYDIKDYKTPYGTRYISIEGRFYKCINTEKKIRLYKYFHPVKNQQGKIYTKKNGDVAGYYKFYVSMPNKLEFTYFWSPTVKNFKKKVSKLLLDCPELSAKIKSQEVGYIYVNGKINLDLWIKIAKEYETCNN